MPVQLLFHFPQFLTILLQFLFYNQVTEKVTFFLRFFMFLIISKQIKKS